MQKITPFLWFDHQAEEAAKFYVSIFPDSKVLSVGHISDTGPEQNENVTVVEFELRGQHFSALNGGPRFQFTEAISFVVDCDTQDEVDHYWNALSVGGNESQCGWLQDKFGLWWQIVPNILLRLMGDKDAVKSQRVIAAMLKMRKIDIAALKKAYEG